MLGTKYERLVVNEGTAIFEGQIHVLMAFARSASGPGGLSINTTTANSTL